MARLFNGTSDIIKRGSVATTVTTNLTMACWIKEVTAASRKVVLNGNRDAGGGDGYGISTISTGSRFSLNVEFVASITGTSPIVLNRWYHVAITRDATTWRLYVNGVEEGTPITNNPNVPSFNTTIGGASKSGGADNTFFAGHVAEVAIWTRKLKTTDIASLAKGLSPAFFPINTVDYLPLIGNTTTENDRTSGPKYVVTGTTTSAHPPIIYPRNFR